MLRKFSYKNLQLQQNRFAPPRQVSGIQVARQQAGKVEGGRRTSKLAWGEWAKCFWFNNALANSSGIEMPCSRNLCYPLEPTALNLRAVAWSIAQTLGLLTASLEHKHTGDWESCFSACPLSFLLCCFWCLFIFKQVVYTRERGEKKKKRGIFNQHPFPSRTLWSSIDSH